jgi:hypothetical protein
MTRKASELAAFAREVDSRKLPEIHGVWSRNYIAPKMREVYACDSVPEFYALGLSHGKSGPLRILSIGSGLCVQEQKVALRLRDKGYTAHIECLEMSPERVAAARKRFSDEGVSELLSVTEQDIDEWKPTKRYDAIMANHSLHHIESLESLFDGCASCSDRLVMNDMIGRNGHQRWPEVLPIVQSIWDTMPREYRYNHIAKRFDEPYDDASYCLTSNEGIRAQDIMPLLLQRFKASHFVAEGGLTDPFIDRKYGHNFSRENAEDVAFVNRLGYMNDILIDAGIIKPTMALAWFAKCVDVQRCYRHWTAEFCTRHS